MLEGVVDVAGGEHGVAAAARRHARRVADVPHGRLDRRREAVLAPGMSVVADGEDPALAVDLLEADGALRKGGVS